MTRNSPTIILLGLPGSGKTTCGQELATSLSLPFQSIGNILRSGRLERTLENSVDPAAEYLSLDISRNIHLYSKGLILDFSPVTAEGGRMLKKTLEGKGFDIVFTVYIKVGLGIARQRYKLRGFRHGDPTTDMELLFNQRITEEFWPYTVPMVRNAFRTGGLLVVNNTNRESRLNDLKNVAGEINAILQK